jgi:transcriptional regulator GlxA family with amidase domain
LYEEVCPLPNLEPGRPPQLIQVDTQGLQLAIEGLCHEAGGEAEPATVDFWAALVHRQAMRMLRPGGGDPRLARLWATVRRDLGGGWNLQRLARTAGLSEESLRRLCQREFGRAPLAHLTHLRMQLAADLLACTQEKIASIATRVGYRDPFAFSNAFKRALHLPPSRYRGRAAQRTPNAPS